MEAIAKVRNIRITPQKARRVVNLIRGKQANEALGLLKFQPQAASEPIYKVVASAVGNAKVKGERTGAIVDEDDLVISQAYVDEGVTLYRFSARARGRASRPNKRTSDISGLVGAPGELRWAGR